MAKTVTYFGDFDPFNKMHAAEIEEIIIKYGLSTKNKLSVVMDGTKKSRILAPDVAETLIDLGMPKEVRASVDFTTGTIETIINDEPDIVIRAGSSLENDKKDDALRHIIDKHVADQNRTLSEEDWRKHPKVRKAPSLISRSLYVPRKKMWLAVMQKGNAGKTNKALDEVLSYDVASAFILMRHEMAHHFGIAPKDILRNRHRARFNESLRRQANNLAGSQATSPR